MLALTLMLSLTVVIDPGHGGSNTGAPGRTPGAFEKQVTLAVARDLAGELRARGFEVLLTRTHDEYLTLRERVRLANAAEPDCFVSLHANASGDRARIFRAAPERGIRSKHFAYPTLYCSAAR